MKHMHTKTVHCPKTAALKILTSQEPGRTATKVPVATFAENTTSQVGLDQLAALT